MLSVGFIVLQFQINWNCYKNAEYIDIFLKKKKKFEMKWRICDELSLPFFYHN